MTRSGAIARRQLLKSGLIIPEAWGGLGLSMLELALLAEEMGRAVVPGPFFSSSVLATVMLAAGGNALVE